MKATVLYIEDNSANLLLVRKVLEAAGYEFLGALTGEEGVRVALASHPQLVLVDIQLPDIDGFEVLRRLRSDEMLARVPVVALTANVMQRDRERAREAGFDGYIVKPIAIAGLRDEVAAHLERALLARGTPKQ